MAESLATQEEKDFYFKQVKIRTGHTRVVADEYFRYPDGEDLPGKLKFATKWAIVGGGIYGLMKALVMAPKPTYREWTFLFVKPIIPAVGMAAAFTITTNMATSFRKKDDSFNYGLGGAAAGVIFGAALRSVPQGVAGVLALSTLAVYLKDLKTPFFPSVHRINFSPYEAKYTDLSFTPYKKGNWSKEKPADE